MNLFVCSHIVSKGYSQVSTQNQAGEPPMVFATQRFWQLFFCSIVGGATGTSTQNTHEESGSECSVSKAK